MTDQPFELAQKDEGFRELMEAWPYLSERARWDIFLRVWWYVFIADLKRVFNHIGKAARAVVDTLKAK